MTRSIFLIIRDLFISLCMITLSFLSENIIYLIVGSLLLIFNVYDYASKDGISLYEIKIIKNENYVVNGMLIKFLNLIISIVLLIIGIYTNMIAITILGCVLLIITVLDFCYKIPLYKIKKNL